MNTSVLAFLAIAIAGFSASADEPSVLPPASERFAVETSETPDFQRHVVPLLGKYGCNGRACHGSFQGRGGFRMSLFGYDFAEDHKSLTAAAAGGDRRVDVARPKQSLILQKPTLAIDHEGGERFAADSWAYRLLENWIAAGGRGVKQERRLQRLDVVPREIVFAADGESRHLRVTAHWDDGTAENVTCLTRFQINDDLVATVDAAGVVATRGRGDTHVVALYDNEVAAVPIMRPVTDQVGEKYPAIAAPTRIDELNLAKLRTLGIVPSELCTDAEFLRRASIDACGTLPTVAEVEAFLADPSPDKRLRKIDELLARPAYAAWWANKLCDYTGNSPLRQSELGQKLAIQWYHWLYRRVGDNMPYDQIVAGIVTAVGREPGQSYDDYANQMTSLAQAERLPDFADRATMPHYWTRSSVKAADDKALAFAHSFLGVRLQCAQCHKHPFDRWSQQDFKQFSALFERVKYGVPAASAEDYKKLAQAVGAQLRGAEGANITPDILANAGPGEVLPWRELFVETRPGSPQRLQVLGDDALAISTADDPRQKLMEWMRKPENPYFARAFVNRVWANYFHVGLIDPPDDANPANPPSNAELLDYLSQDFIAHGYDMRRLHREIMRSNVYQRSWRPNDTNAGDRRHYGRAVPRRLPAEVVYDAVAQATASDERAEAVRTDLERRAIGHLSTFMTGTYAMNVFGKPERTTNCDCERTDDATLLQAVFMQNDPLVRQRLDESGWLADAATRIKSAGSAGEVNIVRVALIREAYLRTVGRPPTRDDTARTMNYFAEANDFNEALYDLMWALLNTKEFLLNH